jgi:hypothetical protein
MHVLFIQSNSLLLKNWSYSVHVFYFALKIAFLYTLPSQTISLLRVRGSLSSGSIQHALEICAAPTGAEPFPSTPLRQPIQILNRSIELRNSSKRMGHFSGKPTRGGAIWVADNAAISFIFPNNAASTRAACLGTHAGRVQCSIKFWLHHPSLWKLCVNPRQCRPGTIFVTAPRVCS